MNIGHRTQCSDLRARPLATCTAVAFGLLGLVDSAPGNAAGVPFSGGAPKSVATALVVANCNDDGNGSLRDAVARAHSGDTVDMSALTCGVITLSTGAIQTALDDLTLRGPGPEVLTIDGTRQAGEPDSVLVHSGSGTLRVDSLKIANANGYCIKGGSLYLVHSTVTACGDGSSKGGGVSALRGFTMYSSTISDNLGIGVSAAYAEGSVVIDRSTISGNRAFSCSGFAFGNLLLGSYGANVRISNSTVSGNYATSLYSAGCVIMPLSISNSTFAFNANGESGSALRVAFTTATIESSIFASAQGTNDLEFHSGGVVTGHDNVVLRDYNNNLNSGQTHLSGTLHVDPLLLPLADNGGPTLTHALAPGSPAIDAGNNSAQLATDQRGFARVVGPGADIGAFEVQPFSIDAAITGSWFNPAQAGHGLMLEVLPNNQLLALWFAFDPSGKQAWFGGVGTYSGNTATIDGAVLPTGGRWIPNFNSSSIVPNTWGTLKFTFSDHDHGHVDFIAGLGFGSGGMDLLRLTNIATQAGVGTAIGSPGAVAADAAGNVYFSSSPNRIFKVDAHGALTRVAGAGQPGYSGDGGAATDARFNFPLSYPELVQNPVDYSELVGGLALDAQHNLYVADAYNNRVRRIDANGIVTTILGNGFRANTGDGGPAAQATIYWPQGVAIDNTGNLLVSSAYGPLRRIAPNGIISALSGANCGAAYLGPGLCVPEQIAVDSSGNVFAPDAYCRVREVRSDGSTLTVAGNDAEPSGGFAFTCGYSGDGGPATAAAMEAPYGVAVDAGNKLYIADTGNHCIRKVAAGIISTVAGKCTQAGFAGDGGAATQALFNHPRGIAVGADGTLYIADTDNQRIRKVAPNGIVTTIAGNGGALVDLEHGTIGPGFTGNWFDPTQSGHGLMLEVLPDNRLLAYWFAFDPAGNQAWFGGVGTYSGTTATIPNAVLPTGARWIPNFDPDSIVPNAWGTLTFTFTSCNRGTVTFNSAFGFGTGSMNLTRLTQPAGLTCP